MLQSDFKQTGAQLESAGFSLHVIDHSAPQNNAFNVKAIRLYNIQA